MEKRSGSPPATVAVVTVPAPGAEQFRQTLRQHARPADCAKKIEGDAAQSRWQPDRQRHQSAMAACSLSWCPVSRHFCSRTNRARRGRTSVSTATTQRRIRWCCTGLRPTNWTLCWCNRETKSTTELPNEPFSTAMARYFANHRLFTEGCEPARGGASSVEVRA